MTEASQAAERARQILLFAAVGGVNTLIDIAIFFFLTAVIGWHLVSANLIAFVVAATNSYLLNRFVTFAGPIRHRARQAILLFALVTSATAVVATLALWGLVYGGIPILIAKAIAVVISVVMNFLGTRQIVFSR